MQVFDNDLTLPLSSYARLKLMQTRFEEAIGILRFVLAGDDAVACLETCDDNT